MKIPIIFISTMGLLSCGHQDYEIIGLRDIKSQYFATVYAADTNWTEMESFAKKIINQRKNKTSKECAVAFYSRKDKTPRTNPDGSPKVDSYEEVIHAQDYLFATYEMDPDNPENGEFEHSKRIKK